jgi:hypothetical protein
MWDGPREVVPMVVPSDVDIREQSLWCLAAARAAYDAARTDDDAVTALAAVREVRGILAIVVGKRPPELERDLTRFLDRFTSAREALSWATETLLPALRESAKKEENDPQRDAG